MHIIIKKEGFLDRSVGDVVSTSTKRAAHLVELGLAEYPKSEEPEKEEKPKKKTVKKEKAVSKKQSEKAVK